MNIDGLDFEHLRLFDALVRKRNLSEAARLLEIPQPTASHALARLRKVFDDQLMVRTRGGMEPTPLALTIAPEVQQILDLERRIASGGRQFSVEKLDREFVIACSDVGQLLVANSIYPAIRTTAPNVRLRTATLERVELVDALQSGEVDIALGAFPRLEAGIRAQTLYRERYSCFAAARQLYMRTRTIEDFMASNHIVVTTIGMAHAHRVAEQRVIQAIRPRQVHLTASSFLVALVAAAESDMIVTAPGRVIAPVARKLGLASAAPPFAVGNFDVKQYWHSREQDDPAHHWLRQQVFQSLASWRS
jgi:DNA-binding transcriptional LysR family regulator